MKKTKLMMSLILLSGVLAQNSAFAYKKQHKPADEKAMQVAYQCELGIKIPVTYINTQAGSSFAVLLVEGKQVPMNNVRSGSGALYASINDAERYRWHTKGDSAILWWASSKKDAQLELNLLKDCKTI